MADEYIAGYLAWRPQTGTALGLHEYDGKVTDYSQASLDAELARLKSFDQRLGQLNTNHLSPQAFYDYRILRSAIQREIFGFEQMRIYSDNPMTYAGALDVNIYIKRNFAPLEERVRSVVAILNQAPQIMAAARANLAESLPRPQVETAIEEAEGAADFLAKDLVAALKDVKNETLMAEFNAANQRAIDEVRAYAAYLKEQKLPKATAPYALGREKYQKLLEYGEMVTLSPEQLLEIGLRELQRKQQVFAEAAREIDPARTPIEVFQRHPEGPSHRAEPDSRHGEGPGHDPAVRDRPPASSPFLRRSARRGGDPAVHARHQLRLDGHARARLKPRPPRPITTSRRWKPIGRRSKRRNG